MSVSTTGYGDIVPVSPEARMWTTVVVTPLRLIFLITFVGTTVELLTERSRQSFRIQRWRSRVRDHTVVVGYGTKGRAAVDTLLGDGTEPTDIVVVDTDRTQLDAASALGLVTVTGNATRSSVLRIAGVQQARAIVVATNRDDTAVLVTLTARELAPNIRIVASVRESENVHLLRQSGANSVIVSAETAGRLLGSGDDHAERRRGDRGPPHARRRLRDQRAAGGGVGGGRVAAAPARHRARRGARRRPATAWTPRRSTRSSAATACSTSARPPRPTTTEPSSDARQGQDERRTRPTRRFDAAEVAAVGPGDAARDREPQPGTTGVGAACLVQPHQPVEDPFPVGGRHPGTGVGHHHRRQPRPRAR